MPFGVGSGDVAGQHMHLSLNSREEAADLIAGGSPVPARADDAIEEFAGRGLPERCGSVAVQFVELGRDLANQDDLTVNWKNSHFC